ncbi:MAG: hypothetical protein ACI9ST_001151 [Psychrobacter glaciei]|jgi:hypothetical protein|uniref:hypothetical protein n=1 Tax=Psychrobacter glaciei TaxID=619771 RepID=UPI0039E4E7EB
MARIFYDFSKSDFIFTTDRISYILSFSCELTYEKCDAFESCKNPVFEKSGKCALHCSKYDIVDNIRYNVLFAELFKNYISESLSFYFRESKDNNLNSDEKIFLGKLDSYSINLDNDLKYFPNLDVLILKIENIGFPKNFGCYNLFDETVNYILEKVGIIVWNECSISIDLYNHMKKSFFVDCVFIKDFYFYNLYSDESTIKLKDEYIFFECTFEGDVSIRKEKLNLKIEVNRKLFCNCIFKKDINFLGVVFKEDVFLNADFYDLIGSRDTLSVESARCINKITIEDCEFKNSFKLNGVDLSKYKERVAMDNFFTLSINYLVVVDSKFNDKLELKNCKVDSIKFDNSNVEKVFDAFESKFEKAYFYKSIFSDFAGFEDVQFGSEQEEGNREFLTIFKYATFMDFSSFRGAKFSSGLDFSKTNLKDTPNFLDVDVGFKNTTRETFRIIKNSFDDVGNNIEANKFFSYEMRAYMIELSNKKGFFLEKLVLYSNFIISDFGRNYIRPLLILVCLLFIYVKSYVFYKVWYQSSIYTLPDILSGMSEELNAGAKGFLPLARFIEAKKGFEFISVLFYILFAILIWQIVVAVKRHTQR